MNVHFVVTMSEKDMEKAEAQGLLEFFKLTSKINTSKSLPASRAMGRNASYATARLGLSLCGRAVASVCATIAAFL